MSSVDADIEETGKQLDPMEMELNPPEMPKEDKDSQMSGIQELAEVTSGLSNSKAMFLVFRSLVGVGILTMPDQINSIGILGALICYPSVALLILYSLDLMVITANDIKFYGQR